MSHVRLGAVQQSLELQPVGVPVRDHVAHLADNRGEYEYANQVADYGEDVPVRDEDDESTETSMSLLNRILLYMCVYNNAQSPAEMAQVISGRTTGGRRGPDAHQ